MSKQRANVRSLVESVIEEQAIGGFPGSSGAVSSSDERLPTAKFVDTNPEAVVQTPAPVPAVPVTPSSDPFRNWFRTKQGQTLSTLRGVNMARLDAVYLDRIEAAYRAGFSDGVGEGI